MRTLLALAAISGFLAVALGAFGAHGLRKKLEAVSDGPRRLEWWHTGASYHLAHSLAIGLSALVSERIPGGWPAAAACFRASSGVSVTTNFSVGSYFASRSR